MTPRYALYDIADLRDRFNLTAGLPKGIRPHYNISPTVNAPVIISHEGLATAVLMKWGLVAKGAKDTNSVFRYRTYTHASETIFSRHSWEQAVRQRRCLVPANGFYELGNEERAHMHKTRAKPFVLLLVFTANGKTQREQPTVPIQSLRPRPQKTCPAQAVACQ